MVEAGGGATGGGAGDEGRFAGRVVLVTGGARGIGAAILDTFLEQGARGISVDVLEPEAPRERVRYITGDLTDRESVRAAFASIEGEEGRLDVLVNNAGIQRVGPTTELDWDLWDQVVATNLTAAFRMTRRAMRPMIRARYGRVVNVASVVGPRANAGQANYAAAKAGLIGMTKTVAAEVARRGVTVNAVAPGFIETDMTADVPDTVMQAVPARRPGTPEEVAAAVRFLASDDAGYVTGTTLFVDGGMSA